MSKALETIAQAESKVATLQDSGGGYKVWGGVPKKRYWTPDGREIFAVPAIRTGAYGVRDANYDKGWLEQKPTTLKPYCSGCDRWHDTGQEVEECLARKASERTKADEMAKKEYAKEHPEVDKIQKLEKRIDSMEEMMSKIYKAVVKNG